MLNLTLGLQCPGKTKTFSAWTTSAKLGTFFIGKCKMSIVQNRKAHHDYFIEEKLEAGLVLQGWEVKAIRAGRIQLKESYIVWQKGAFWLIGAHISALTSASTHVHADPTRSRKLLLHQAQINKFIGKVERAGYTLVALDLHYKNGNIKTEIGLAKGKKQHDKRETEKQREWQREKQRLIREKG